MRTSRLFSIFFLGEIPIGLFADDIRILGDNLFLLDRMRGVKYYQYRIVGD
jgi:hypothetical protein